MTSLTNDREHLIVAGTGIQAAGQLTTETIAWIRRMDQVLYVVSDRETADLIRSLNSSAESLLHLYEENRPRQDAYERMIAVILSHLHAARRVCFVTYGHPGVFVYPTHEVVRRARAQGFAARMLPAISADACMIADLGIDMKGGTQAFEATEFLISSRPPDPFAHVLLWQVGGLGDSTYKQRYDLTALPQLTNKLLRYYGPMHVIYLYEAAVHAGGAPSIRGGYLIHLPYAAISPNATLYIPPLRSFSSG